MIDKFKSLSNSSKALVIVLAVGAVSLIAAVVTVFCTGGF